MKPIMLVGLVLATVSVSTQVAAKDYPLRQCPLMENKGRQLTLSWNSDRKQYVYEVGKPRTKPDIKLYSPYPAIDTTPSEVEDGVAYDFSEDYVFRNNKYTYVVSARAYMVPVGPYRDLTDLTIISPNGKKTYISCGDNDAEDGMPSSVPQPPVMTKKAFKKMYGFLPSP